MEIYSPKEDSHLLSEQVTKYIKKKKNKNISVLDMGTGSGIQAENCVKNKIPKNKILVVDINPKAIKNLSDKGFRSIKSNLFENISGKFDLIIFNPPYLPESEHDKEKDTTGGKKGYETILKFLKQVRSHLNPKSRIFIVFSTLTKLKKSMIKHYKITEKARKKLFFEELIVWELSIKTQKTL